MREYILTAKVTISIYTAVEAESIEDAIEQASDRTIEAANWSYSDQKKEVWVSHEYDGEPFDIELIGNIHEETEK